MMIHIMRKDTLPEQVKKFLLDKNIEKATIKCFCS